MIETILEIPWLKRKKYYQWTICIFIDECTYMILKLKILSGLSLWIRVWSKHYIFLSDSTL